MALAPLRLAHDRPVPVEPERGAGRRAGRPRARAASGPGRGPRRARRKRAPALRANSHASSAVRRLPRCSGPLGLGAKRPSRGAVTPSGGAVPARAARRSGRAPASASRVERDLPVAQLVARARRRGRQVVLLVGATGGRGAGTVCGKRGELRGERLAPPRAPARAATTRFDEPDRERLLGADRPPGEDQVERAAEPDEARQPHRAAVDQRHAPAPAEHAEAPRPPRPPAGRTTAPARARRRPRGPRPRRSPACASSMPRRAHRAVAVGRRRGCAAGSPTRLEVGARRRTCRRRPVSTADRAPSSSASNARKASASACAVGRSTALRTSGRSRITVVTGPLRSTLTPIAVSLDGRSREPARVRAAAAGGGGSYGSGRNRSLPCSSTTTTGRPSACISRIIASVTRSDATKAVRFG